MWAERTVGLFIIRPALTHDPINSPVKLSKCKQDFTATGVAVHRCVSRSIRARGFVATLKKVIDLPQSDLAVSIGPSMARSSKSAGRPEALGHAVSMAADPAPASGGRAGRAPA